MKSGKLLLLTALMLTTNAYAEVVTVPVISSTPIYNNRVVYDTPTRTCVKREVYVDSNSSNFLGGVVGAFAGHVITRKLTGSTVNRVLGTAAGAMIGSSIEDRYNSRKQIVNDCVIEENTHTEQYISGYNVSYKVDGNLMSSVLAYNPGAVVKVNINRTYRLLR
jgi:uncharacterized protein YcfJ